MQTLTINLPDSAYYAALSFTPAERDRLAAIMFAHAKSEIFADAEAVAGMEDDPTLPDYDRETNEDDLEAIGRSLTDEAAGRIIPGEVVLAALMAQARNGRE